MAYANRAACATGFSATAARQRAPRPGRLARMPVHEPAPTQPTNKCPKCGAEGVVQQAIGNMVTYACPKCGARWVAQR